MSNEILDLDVFAPPARSAKFTDRAGKVHTFGITFISFKTSMFMLAHIDEFRSMMKMDSDKINEEMFRLILGIIEEIATQTDKQLTVDFLYENLSVEQGVKLIEVAMTPILEFLNANPQEAEAEEVESRSALVQ